MNLNKNFVFASILMLSLLISACYPRTYDTIKRYDTAYDLDIVLDLDGKDLYFKLENREKQIKNMERLNQTMTVRQLKDEDNRFNAFTKEAFRDLYSFSNVHFFKNEKLYFNTRSIEIESLNGEKSTLELGEEQILIGEFLKFNGLTKLLIKRWPEMEESNLKEAMTIEFAGGLSKSNIRMMVRKLQDRLMRVKEGRRINR